MNEHQNTVHQDIIDLKSSQHIEQSHIVDHNYYANSQPKSIPTGHTAVRSDVWQEVTAKTKKRSVTTYEGQSEKRSKVGDSSVKTTPLELSKPLLLTRFVKT
jgi:hypothetical protein